MKKIVECVPNFSEGRDLNIIEKITNEIKSVSGAALLDVDPGKATNRTVVTFAGTPEAVEEAAFLAIKKAAELIDMSKHTGAHARMGATDVCPFIPVSGVTVDECIEISRRLGKRVGEDLKIPVYLYGKAATRPDRVKMPDIRKGEYEALAEKLKREDFRPDFGEPVFNARSGATVTGVRDFLIAYNINLNSRDPKIANKIAKRIREKGRMVKNKETGKKEKVPGIFTGVQGMGWYIEEYNMAQITVNIMDYKQTPVYRIFEECEKLALQFGVRITGSEVVGMVPLDSLTQAGKHYLKKQGSTTGVSEAELVRIAIQSLGFNEISEFKPEDRIIEYKIREKGKLVSMNLYEFLDELASDSPAPGGGSVAALNGALSAGLSTMVGNLTYSKKNYKEVREEMISLSEKGQELKDFFVDAIDKDTDAFNKIMDAFTLPKGNDEEKKAKDAAIQEATKEATLVPFSVLEKSLEAAKIALTVARSGNKNSLSDSGVAGLCASSSAYGALYNVMINIIDIEDEGFKAGIVEKARSINAEVQTLTDQVKELLTRELKIN